ncbi:MAG: trigger factor [Chthonomonadaceae bacterium]|nr:trigger factor [Chthonomonadaceae bacterium]
MQITREDLNPCTVSLDVVCDAEAVSAGFEKAFKTLAKQMRVPGFRPGHAPKAVVEKMVEREHLYDAAADAIVRSVVKKALEQEKLEPFDRPSVDLKKLDRDAGECEFSVKVPLAPKVELGDYHGLKAEVPNLQVTDEEVQHQIDELRRRYSTREAITGRGVEEGDVAVVNIKPEGQEGDGRNFMTIAGQTFPALDAALMGMKAEEMKQLELTFPDNFQEKDWQGQTYPCRVTLRSVSSVTLPNLDDEFAKELNLEGMKDLENRMREQIGNAKRAMIQDYVNEQLLEDLASRSTIHVPDTMWEGVANQRLRELAQEQQKKGKTLEQYAAENNMTVEQMVEAWKTEAKTQVIRAIMVREIFAREKMSLSNTELNDELGTMAREFEMPPDQLVEALKKNNALDELHFRALFRKVTLFLDEHAKKQEVAAGSAT